MDIICKPHLKTKQKETKRNKQNSPPPRLNPTKTNSQHIGSKLKDFCSL